MLLIDSHEPKEIIEKMQSAIPIRVLRLKYGDYSFSDVAIERKTLSDFFSSLKSNRLKEQMENIGRCYTEKYLLIEGFFDFSYVNNIGYLYSELADIMLDFDFKILFSKDKEFTCKIIERIYRIKNLNYNKNPAKKEKIYHAMNFFWIGRRRLEILFSEFKSMSGIARADKRELMGIKSVGKRTVQKVKDALELNIFEEKI